MPVKKRLIRLSTRALIGVGRYVDPRLAVRAGNLLARHVKLDPRVNKRQLRDNLKLYFPDRDARWVEETAREIQAKAAQARIFDKWFLPTLPLGELDAMIDRVGWEPVDAVFASRRGVIVVSLHYGRFWAAPIWATRHGIEAGAFQASGTSLPDLARTLSRGSFSASDRTSALRAVRALKGGSAIFLQLDAGRLHTPLVVDFLGHATHVSGSTIRLARAADAVIMPAHAVSDPNDPERIILTVCQAIDPREIPEGEPLESTMRRILEPLEEQVRRDPSQWHGAFSAHRRLARNGAARNDTEDL